LSFSRSVARPSIRLPYPALLLLLLPKKVMDRRELFFFLLSVTCFSGASPSTQRILNLHVFFLFHGFPSRFLTLAFMLLSFLLFSLLVLMLLLLYNEHTYHIPVNHALSVS